MRALTAVAILGSVWIVPLATAQPSVFFHETFDGPLDASIWRTEILTGGPRWCGAQAGTWWGTGYWAAEGQSCYGVPAASPYGYAVLSDGLFHVSSDNGRAFPFLAARLPGTVPLFPPSGDFIFTVSMRFDGATPLGDGLVVSRTTSTEPVGDSPCTLEGDIALHVWCDSGAPGVVQTSLGGTFATVATLTPSTAMHEIALRCVGTSFTIAVDQQVVYGPVTSSLRPNAVWIGNPLLNYWYPTDWSSFSVDDIRVELPGPPEGACCFPVGVCLRGTEVDCRAAGGSYAGDGTPCHPSPCGPTAVEASTWGRVKAGYRR